MLPRIGGRRLWRHSELAAGRAWGIVFYPLTVLILVIVFHRRLEVAAVAWGMLAFGDGTAGMLGSRWGSRTLPWNREKSWIGMLSYWLCGGLAGWALLVWTVPGRYDPAFALVLATVVALFGAVLESVPLGLDDNVATPLLSALLLSCLLLTEGSWASLAEVFTPWQLLLGFAVNGGLATLAYRSGSSSLGGSVAGLALGTVVWSALDWRGYLLLLTFVLVGTGATRLGYRQKVSLGLAEADQGRRGAGNVIANLGVAAACAFFAVMTPMRELFVLTFAAALAAATADTLESEIGQLWGGRPRLLTTWRAVPAGTDGAVSSLGTLAGAVGSLLLAALGWGVGFYSPAGLLVVTAAGFFATLLESLIGATLERAGLLNNDAVNTFNTLAGALLAVAVWCSLGA